MRNIYQCCRGQTAKYSFQSVRRLFYLFILLILPFLFSTQAIAQFEVDGNTVSGDHTPAGEDWNNVYNGTSTATITTGILPDAGGFTGLLENSYIGGGTKDDNDFPAWEWQYTSVSDKTDILNGAAALYGQKIYFFGDRFSNDGATNIGFWFLQDEIGIQPPVGNVKGKFTGSHVIGDILVVAEISQGGVVGNAAAYRWVGAGNGSVPNDTKSLEPLSINATSLFAVVNSSTITVPWGYLGKQGLPQGQVPDIAFFEGMIDLGALQLSTDACFSSFLIETRASFSVSSILEDFLLGSFNVKPDVEVASVQICNEPGASTTLTATVDGGVGTITYQWSTTDGNITSDPTQSSITVDQVGTYQVIAYGESIDGTPGGCASVPATATVTYYPTPAVQATPTNISCFGETDGMIVAVGSGGSGGNYMYSLDGTNYQSSGTFMNLSAGSYTVYVQDGNGCTATTTTAIIAPPEVTISLLGSDPTCFGSTDGSITATAGGGDGSYEYSLDNSTWQASNVFNTLGAGSYTVYVRDGAGCLAQDDVTLNQNPQVTVSLEGSDPTCFGS
ncbi:SprB repeat-containing protein, partial [Fulvivirga sedimenti]